MEQPQLDEIEVERWRTGLDDCSFDRRDKIDPPTKELIGTPNERLIVTRLEVNRGIMLVRKFAAIAKVPNNFNVPPRLTDVFDKSKIFYALSLSVEFMVKSFVYYTDDKFCDVEEDLAEVAHKLLTLTKFADIVRSKLIKIQDTVGNPNIHRPDPTPTLTPYERPTARLPNRPTRTTKSRKDPTRKSFSLSDRLDSVRARTQIHTGGTEEESSSDDT